MLLLDDPAVDLLVAPHAHSGLFVEVSFGSSSSRYRGCTRVGLWEELKRLEEGTDIRWGEGAVFSRLALCLDLLGYHIPNNSFRNPFFFEEIQKKVEKVERDVYGSSLFLFLCLDKHTFPFSAQLSPAKKTHLYAIPVSRASTIYSYFDLARLNFLFIR
jgi:hypothetical protein